jgi:subtilase family serine protease
MTYEAGYDYEIDYPSSTVIQILNPGDSILLTTTLSTQIWFTDGPHYVLVYADDANVIEERLETNNIASVAINFIDLGTKDVFASNASLNPEVAAAGDNLDLDYLLNNGGTASLSTSATAIYFSDDAVFDANTDDLLLTGNPSSTISAGSSIPIMESGLGIPSDAADGQYYLFIVVDYLDNISESDETNNVLMVPLRVVQPGALDLRISSASLVSPVTTSGANVLLNFTLKNSGIGAIASSSTGIYFSVDNSLDGIDQLLSSYLQPAAFNPSESFNEQGYTLTLPAGLIDGNYFLLIKADNTDIVDEFDEANNITVVPFIINSVLAVEKNQQSFSSVLCYPNPVKDQVTFEVDETNLTDEKTLTLFNALGEKVLEKFIPSSKFQLNISTIVPGIYTYSISGRSEKGKLVIVR